MRVFRLSFILLIAVLASTCVLSSTFAKYTSSITVPNEARVAKWGVNIEMSGSLFGEAYKEAPNNTITNNDDGSVTVKTQQNATVSNLVSPGTNVTDGFRFSITGQPETAIRLDWKIANQNVALRPNIYGIMEKIGPLTQEQFEELERMGKMLYVKSKTDLLTGSEPGKTNISKPGYVKAKKDDANSTTEIYELCNVVEVNHPNNNIDANTRYNYPYCPVVFELRSNESGSVTGYYNGGQVSLIGKYWVYRNDKSLDILSAAIDRALGQPTNTWPVASKDTDWKFVRTGSSVLSANTDLTSLKLVDENLVWHWDYEQYSDGNVYARLFEDGKIDSNQQNGYNAADTILATLAGKKSDGAKEVKQYENVEVVIHNRSVMFNGQNDKHVVFEAYKNKNGSYRFKNKGLENWDNLADEWIAPTEYEDYCLDVNFDLEVTISQVD